MHKLCLPFLSLVLAAPALADAAEPAATASASVTAKVTVSDQDALSDDILAVIDLPLAAAEAREAGVEETELKAALDTSRAAGLPASDATEVIAVEAEQTRARGAKKGFGQWVRQQVAAGLRGKKLADKVKQRKEDTKQLDAAQQAELDTKIAAQAETNRAWRAKQLEKRRELVAKGKAPVIGHKDRHDQLLKISAKLDKREDKIDAKQDENAARLADIEAKLATATDAEKTRLEAEKARLEKQAGRLEKREDKLEKAEAKLDAKAETGKPIPRPGIPDTRGDLKAADHKNGPHPGKGADKKAADKKAADGSTAQ